MLCYIRLAYRKERLSVLKRGEFCPQYATWQVCQSSQLVLASSVRLCESASQKYWNKQCVVDVMHIQMPSD